MIKHIWTTLSKKSVIDSETNSLSIHDILEQLNVDIKVDKDKPKPKEINIPIEFEVTSLWVKDEKNKSDVFEGFFSLDLIAPNGDKLSSFENILNIPKENRRMRTRMKINGLKLTNSGDYIFKLSYKGKNDTKYKKVAEIPLEIFITQK